MARSITDGETPGLIVSRSEVIASYGSRIETKTEECISDLIENFSGGFKIVRVTPPLLQLVQKQIGAKVEIRRIESADDNPLYGYVEVGKDSAVIRYRSDLNICWRRYTVAKELFHLYAGIAEDMRPRESDAVTQAAMDARKIIPSDGKQLEDEVAAFYLALEYLMPWRLREQFDMLRDLAATSYQIAKVFMIPRPFVEHLCEGGYAELSYRINKNI